MGLFMIFNKPQTGKLRRNNNLHEYPWQKKGWEEQEEERRRGAWEELKQQKETEVHACLWKSGTLLQGPGAQWQQTWPAPHPELVDRNLMLALMSELHSRKWRRRGLWDRKYSLHLPHVKHKPVCDCVVAATWGTHQHPPSSTLASFPSSCHSHTYRPMISNSLTVFVIRPWGQLGHRSRPVPIYWLLVERPVTFPFCLLD